MFRKILLSAVLIAASTAATADPVVTFSEGFDNVATLAASGWIQANNSTPGGSTGWFQGNSDIFAADSGAADSYIAANFLNAPDGGNIDNWLISPVFSIEDGSVISFSTRTADKDLGDNLQVLYSFGGTNFADFISLTTITSAGYPIDWTAISAISSGLSADIRFAFRYLVTNTAAPSGDYIGIDSFVVTTVPEPGVLALFGIALLMLAFAKRRRKAQG